MRGASRFAFALGISPLVVGLTFVAYATGAPELAVSIGAAAKVSPDIALGNVIGSNIFNVLFIAGLSASMLPLVISGSLVRKDVPVMAGLSLIVLAFAADGRIAKWESTVLVLCGCCYSALMVAMARKASRQSACPRDHRVQLVMIPVQMIVDETLQ